MSRDIEEAIVGKCCSFCYIASKEGEITVHFWNGKTATVPRGGVRWVPPAVWKKAVERLHKPLIKEHPSPLLWVPCCCLLGPAAGHVSTGLSLGSVPVSSLHPPGLLPTAGPGLPLLLPLGWTYLVASSQGLRGHSQRTSRGGTEAHSTFAPRGS